MTLSTYFRKAISLPPHTVVARVLRLIHRIISQRWTRLRDQRLPTFILLEHVPLKTLNRYLETVPAALLRPHTESIRALSQLVSQHTFDLLGSGWVEVRHGLEARGLEGHKYTMGRSVTADHEGRWLAGRINPANLSESQRIWHLIEAGYQPIDWHIDFKSGYRWDEATWFTDIPYGHRPGVDVKVPWELARMQHLVWLAWAFVLDSDGAQGFEEPEQYKREFRNQVLDFIACNPPRYGVNWRTPMDIAIRAANMLLALDLFRASGATFDQEFEAELFRSITQHGQHIVTHLEWSLDGRGNHYLSDIVGLLFIATYLPSSPQVDAWLAFATQELIGEIEYQFNPDGSNFEASTSYHRLASEMCAYGLALVLGLPEEKRAAFSRYDHHLLKSFPPLKPGPLPLIAFNNNPDHLTPLTADCLSRIEKAAEFTLHITRPDGNIAQIGDNDSGRFLKLLPALDMISMAQAKQRYASLAGYTDLPDSAPCPDENILDHRHLLAAIGGLFNRQDLIDEAPGWELEAHIIRQLAQSAPTSYRQSTDMTATQQPYTGTLALLQQIRLEQESMPKIQHDRLEIATAGHALLDGLSLYGYPDFGLYIYHSQHLYLAVRCGSIGQHGNGGHAHNDQLSIELWLEGKAIFTDPGTYVYTSLPTLRNQYRSIRAHAVPRLLNFEPFDMSAGLFELRGDSQAQCLVFLPEGFAGLLHTRQGDIVRRIELYADRIVIEDTLSWVSDGSHQERQAIPQCVGYGKQLA
jgi:hypothetical protein